MAQPHEPKLRVLVSADASMTRGKYAAQAVHAALTALDVHPGVPVVVLGASRAEIEQQRVVIRDAGRTEVAPGTVTAGTDWAAPEHSDPLAETDAESADAWRVLADLALGSKRGNLIDLALPTRRRIAAALRQAAAVRDGKPIDSPGIDGVVLYDDGRV